MGKAAKLKAKADKIAAKEQAKRDKQEAKEAAVLAKEHAKTRKNKKGELPAGIHIEALHGGGEDWYPAEVLSYHEDDDTYELLYEDGDHEDHVARYLIR